MHDFVAIGDIVTDAFIKLKDASVNCDVNNEHCTITMSFSDKVPYESVDVVRAVGNSSNAAVAASRLGLNSALVTNMGDDANGRECLDVLKNEGISLEFVDIHKGLETNYHYVLWYGDDRTILVKHQKYPRRLPDIKRPKWLYLASLGGDTLEYHGEIIEYIKNHKDVKLAFQPGTFQMKAGYEAFKEIYQNCQIFFCNTEEAERILGVTGLKIEEVLEKMRALGPKIVVITEGPKGLYAFDGENKIYLPAYPDPKPPLERTGAGDALASTTVAALALGKTLEQALMWGLVNSMSVVQQVGAQKGLLTREKIEEYLNNCPQEFKTKKL